MTKPRCVLVDGTSLLYRSFFALPQTLARPDGLQTNASYGVALTFRKVFDGRRPQFGAVVFDAPAPTFRKEAFEGYKRSRPSMPSELREQLPWVDRLVAVHRFPALRIEGVEADDVVATLTTLALAGGCEVHILAADKDFVQLLSPDVRMIDTVTNRTVDLEYAQKRWGVPPSQFVDYLALVGDKIDDVPGVPGIGPKSALKLLSKYGSLAAILEHADEIKGNVGRLLTEHKDLALLSQHLVTLRRDVPLPIALPDLALVAPDTSEIDDLYRELAFYSLMSPAAAKQAEGSERRDFAPLTSVAEVNELVGECATRPAGICVVYSGPTAPVGDLVGIAIASTSDVGRYVPIEGVGGLGAAALDALRGWLEDVSAPKIIHGARDGWTVLSRSGITLRGVVGDPGLASFLIEPTKIMPHHLNQVVREYMQHPLTAWKTLAGAGQKETPATEIEVDALAEWAGARAAATLAVWPVLQARLDEAGLRRQHDEVDLPLAWVLGRMQRDGVRVDRAELQAMGEEFAGRKTKVEREIYDLAGHTFNIDSPKQLATVLYEELGLPVYKRTKTGYSTAVDVLERLAPRHPIAQLVVRQRALAKLINTYTNVLSEAVDARDGRVHAIVAQTMSVSGRLITTEPDLQRTPVRTEDGKRIRAAFIPAEGWRIISADWSQIELRILAHLSGDTRLVEAFHQGIDVHRRTASEIFGIRAEDVTATQREQGKTINFATIYGQGAAALGQQLSVPKAEATRLIERYFTAYQGVSAWRDETIENALTQGYVTTLLGRRRFVHELSARNPTTRAYGERIALNTPIQGSAADLCRLALLGVGHELEARGMKTRLLMQIHDELVLETPADEEHDAVDLVRHAMEHAAPLRVPLVVDVGVGASWANAKD